MIFITNIVLYITLVIDLWSLLSALLLMTFYQCVKFYLIPFYTFRDILLINIAKISKGSNSVNTVDMVTIPALCKFI